MWIVELYTKAGVETVLFSTRQQASNLAVTQPFFYSVSFRGLLIDQGGELWQSEK